MRPAPLCLMLLILVVTETAAQPSPVPPGSRIRVTHHCGLRRLARGVERACERDIGTLRAVTPSDLVLDREASDVPISVALRMTARLEVSRGQWTFGRGRGGAIGLLLGGGVGLVLGALGELVLCAGDCGGTALTVGLVAGSAGGVAIGTTMGGQRRDRWQRVPLSTLRTTSLPPQRRIGLGTSIRF